MATPRAALPLSENDAAFEVNRNSKLTESQQRCLRAGIWFYVRVLVAVLAFLFVFLGLAGEMQFFALTASLLIAISIYPIWIYWGDAHNQPVYACVRVRKERWHYYRWRYGRCKLHLPNNIWLDALPHQYDAIRDGWTYELYYTPRSRALLSFRPWATDFGPFQPPR